jgi:hypothetical protein
LLGVSGEAPPGLGFVSRAAVVLLFVCVVTLARASGASADNEGPPLAAVAHGSDVHLFWRGSNGDLYENIESAGKWQGPADTGIDSLASAPTAAIGPAGADYVFWKGADGALWEASTTGSGWSGPVSLGMGQLGSQPAAASWTDSSGQTGFVVMWQGTDGALWEGWYSGGIWNGPQSLGMGPLGSAPTVGAISFLQSSAIILANWRGTQGDLWEAITAGGPAGSFSGPTDDGMGPLGSAPSEAISPDYVVWVVWEGTDGRLWETRGYKNTWTGPYATGVGPLGSAPTVVITDTSSDQQTAFWIGADGNIWEATGSENNWSGPASVGPLAPYPSNQQTPVQVSTPTPKGLHALHVRMVMGWTWHGGSTRLRWIRFLHLPRHHRLRISCRGRGCPPPGQLAKKTTLRRAVKALERRHYRAGQRLTIELSAPGFAPERIEVLIHFGELPLERLL